MTLIVTALNSRFVAQVSDRRLSINRVPHAEYANKTVVFECNEGIFVVSFTGIAKLGDMYTDDWMYWGLAQNNVTEKNMGQVISTITAMANLTFSQHALGKSENDYLEFALAGFHKKGKRLIPYYYEIRNRDAQDKISSKFYHYFIREKKIVKDNEIACLLLAGDYSSVDQRVVEHLHEKLKNESNGEKFVKEMVGLITQASKISTTINKTCISFLNQKNENTIIEYFPGKLEESQVAYTPHIILKNRSLGKSKFIGSEITLPINSVQNMIVRGPKPFKGNFVYFGSKKEGPKYPN